MTVGENDAIHFDDSGIVKIMGFDKWSREVSLAFDRAVGMASRKYLKDANSTFASAHTDFRAIEAQFVKQFENNEENVLQVRRIIAEYLLQAAWDKEQPFETCQRCWSDLQKLGFYCIEREALQTGVFAACCLDYGQIDLGLAVVDPFIAKLERLRAEPPFVEQVTQYYDHEFQTFQKLRARLEAERADVGPLDQRDQPSSIDPVT